MFSIHRNNEDGFFQIILRDDATGTCAIILPGCGAILHEFSVIKNDERINVIVGYNSMDDWSTNLTQKGFRGCKLSPFAGRIKNGNYTFGERNYTIEKYYFRGNAMHGCIYDGAFEIIDEKSDPHEASISLRYQYRKADVGYPFDYDCIITWKLQQENLLTATTQIHNLDQGLIPIQDGWHPYFTLGGKVDDYLLEFQSMEKFLVDEHQIPSGKKVSYGDFSSLSKIGTIHFDDCFSLNMNTCKPLAVIKNLDSKIRVDFFPSDNYPFLQLFTPDDRSCIAIENMSAPPDCFNNHQGLKILSPGDIIDFEIGYQIVAW